MSLWAGFYERLFNFREIRYFSIEGEQTGLFSRALTSPCGKIRIPINESQDDKSQIEEYLSEYKGEGIQHIALGTNDIYRTVDALRGRGIEFQDTPSRYYRGGRCACHWPPGTPIRTRATAHLDRRQCRERHSPANLHQERHRPDFLRSDPTQGQRRLR